MLVVAVDPGAHQVQGVDQVLFADLALWLDASTGDSFGLDAET